MSAGQGHNGQIGNIRACSVAHGEPHDAIGEPQNEPDGDAINDRADDAEVRARRLREQGIKNDRGDKGREKDFTNDPACSFLCAESNRRLPVVHAG